MNSLYVLGTTEASDSRYFAGGQWVNDTRERCPACGWRRPETEPAEIHIALNHIGRRGFVEYLWNSHSLPLFREDLVTLWQRTGLTGFHLKPVRIVGWYNQPKKALPPDIPQYYRLQVLNHVRLKEPPPTGDACRQCGIVTYAFPKLSTHLPNGIAIDRDTWDGSDFCGVFGYVFVFCSRLAAEVTLSAGYSHHISFVREADWSRWEMFNVRDWNPKEYQRYIEGFLIRRVKDL